MVEGWQERAEASVRQTLESVSWHRSTRPTQIRAPMPRVHTRRHRPSSTRQSVKQHLDHRYEKIG